MFSYQIDFPDRKYGLFYYAGKGLQWITHIPLLNPIKVCIVCFPTLLWQNDFELWCFKLNYFFINITRKCLNGTNVRKKWFSLGVSKSTLCQPSSVSYYNFWVDLFFFFQFQWVRITSGIIYLQKALLFFHMADVKKKFVWMIHTVPFTGRYSKTTWSDQPYCRS